MLPYTAKQQLERALKPACSATETRFKIEISLIASLDMILSKNDYEGLHLSECLNGLHLCCSTGKKNSHVEAIRFKTCACQKV